MPAASKDASMDRRHFLRRTSGLVLGLGLVPLVGCEDNSVEPLAPGTEIPFLTPTEDYYVQHGGAVLSQEWGGVQQIARDDWTLTVDGLVETPLTLRFSDLEPMMDEAVTVLKTMRCITDSTAVPGLIGNALWTGIPLRRVLEQAGVDRERTQRLRLYGSDGFTNNLPLDRVFGNPADDLFEPLLVFAMNGEPLTAEHGFPVRLIVHEQYGYKNVKWLERIEATESDAPFGTYQDVLGFIDDGVVRVVNKVTNPQRGQSIAAGAFKVFGYALSGFAGIERVEVAIDDGPFEAARIVPLDEIIAANPEVRTALQVEEGGRFPYPYTGVWALWEFQWQATPGSHTIRVRATDAAGNTQPPEDVTPEDGFNPVFAVEVEVSG